MNTGTSINFPSTAGFRLLAPNEDPKHIIATTGTSDGLTITQNDTGTALTIQQGVNRITTVKGVFKRNYRYYTLQTFLWAATLSIAAGAVWTLF